jgi:sec-independent protein translocase protein TatA
VTLADIFSPEGIVIILAVVVVLMFGGSKLPKLARGLGSASHEFKKGMESGDDVDSTPDAKGA